MSRNANEISASENQSKFCQARVTHVEKNLGLICDTIGSITRKNARLRDKGDLLAGYFKTYADAERLNSTTRRALSSLAESYSSIQDYKQAEVHRLEAKVLRPLTQYGNICKQMKTTIKREIGAIKKERQTRQKLDKVRQRNPGDRQQIAETEVQRASQDASLSSRALESEMERFEKDKLSDFKRALTEYLNIEMTFHARALENLAKCFEDVSLINEYSDAEEFRAALVDTTGTSRHLAGLGTLSSLGTTGTFGSTTLPSMDSTQTDRKQAVRYSDSMYGEEDDDDEVDDEEEDDEEEEQPSTSRVPQIRVRYA